MAANVFLKLLGVKIEQIYHILTKCPKMGLLWRILCTFMKKTDFFSIRSFEIDPFTNQIVTFLGFYDKVDILGHIVT